MFQKFVNLMLRFFDNYLLMCQLPLEYKGASTYSLCPPTWNIHAIYLEIIHVESDKNWILGPGFFSFGTRSYFNKLTEKKLLFRYFTLKHFAPTQQVIPVERFPCQQEELSSKAWGLNLYLVQTSLSSGRLHILLVSKE